MKTRLLTASILAIAALTLTGCAHSGPPTLDDCVKANAHEYGKLDTPEGQRIICQKIKDTSTAAEWQKLYG